MGKEQTTGTKIKFPKGSEWRKWDLHFHTPSSYDYKDSSITNEEIISTLVENDIEVVAITDHHLIDIERIKELGRLAADKGITVLPGIEFLSGAGGSNYIHFIAIFSEDLSGLDHIWDQIKNRTEIAKIYGGSKKPNEIYCSLNETIKIVKELGGLVTIHAGKKSNSIECITNSLPHTTAQKIDISDAVDIFELGQETDQDDYRNIVFPKIKKVIPMIICSDNHNVKQYKLKQNCWIKADPTFEGLHQVIFEPEERIAIQEENPNYEFNKPYFSEININENIEIFSDDDVLSFEKNKLTLNKNLVSIIGGRGSGKSRLVDYAAFVFQKSNLDDKYNPSSHFSISYCKNNSDSPDVENYSSENENHLDFIYISQAELKGVTNRDKIGDNVKKLLDLKGGDFNTSRDLEIQNVLKEIVDLKKWFSFKDQDGDSVNNRKWIQSFLNKQKALLKSIETQDNKEKLKRYTKNIEKIKRIEVLDKNLAIIQNEIGDSLINTKIKDFNTESVKISNDLKNITELDFSQILKDIRSNFEKLELEKAGLVSSNEKIKEEFEKGGYKGDLTSLLSNADDYKTNISYSENQLIEIEKQEKALVECLQQRALLSDKIVDEYERQSALITNEWSKILDKHGSDKELIQEILLEDDSISVGPEIYFDKEIFYQKLSNVLDGRSFSKKKIEEDFAVTDLRSWSDFVKNKLPDFLEGDNLQYVRGDLESIFFNLYERSQYLRVVPQIKYKGKTLDKVSVGQRGTAFLRLRLATQAFSKPIIFDQPEDDLDNEFIMKSLIDIFKKLKKYRQIIIVTHNANLVVNSDSEQVIIAQNVGEKLSYISGSLENDQIIEEVCKILEGGRAAFDLRKRKYNFQR